MLFPDTCQVYGANVILDDKAPGLQLQVRLDVHNKAFSKGPTSVANFSFNQHL